MKTLKSNNGGEFKDFCAREGMERVDNSIKCSTKWGRERRNMTVIGATKAILHDQDFPIFLWAKACNAVVYL